MCWDWTARRLTACCLWLPRSRRARNIRLAARSCIARSIAGLAFAPGAAFRALPGLGAEATVAEATAIVGSHRLFEDRQLCTPALHARVDEVESTGATAVLVGHGGAPLGVIGLADRMRTDGRAAVSGLRNTGVERIVLLTGDVRASAERALAGTGLDEAHAELLPAQKVEAIQALRERYGPVAMVGDGINDAPGAGRRRRGHRHGRCRKRCGARNCRRGADVR